MSDRSAPRRAVCGMLMTASSLTAQWPGFFRWTEHMYIPLRQYRHLYCRKQRSSILQQFSSKNTFCRNPLLPPGYGCLVIAIHQIKSINWPHDWPPNHVSSIVLYWAPHGIQRRFLNLSTTVTIGPISATRALSTGRPHIPQASLAGELSSKP